MRIIDIKPLLEDAEPFVVRLLTRAFLRGETPIIDFKDFNGRKVGTLTTPGVPGAWRDGLGNRIPIYDFRGTTSRGDPFSVQVPVASVDRLMTLTQKGGRLLLTNAKEKVQEMQVPGEPPIWANIILRSFDSGRPVYFASGVNRIVGLDFKPSTDGTSQVTLQLKKDDEEPSARKGRYIYKVIHQTYNIPERSYDRWTLSAFNDGVRLTMRRDEPVTEDVSEPAVVSMCKKLLGAGEKVYFVDRAGKKSQVRRVDAGLSASGKKTWWFYGTAPGARPLVWRSIDTIDKLSLKKDGADWDLFDRTVKKAVKPVTETLGTEEPLIVTLINQRVAKGGAVEVDVPVLPAGRRFKGWVVKPVTTEPSSSGAPIYRLVTASHHSGARGKVLHLTASADDTYRLQKAVDGNGNPYLRMVRRDAE